MRLLLLAAPLLLAGCFSDFSYVNETVVVTEDITLTEDVRKTKYRFNTPNVVLDGQGRTIDGQCNTACVGLVITADNVVVRNLTLRGFDGGVTIGGGVTGVRFENVTVTDNIQHGIYVDKHVSNFNCINCKISDNGSMGIYLEYGTHGNIIENSEISFNGFRDKDTGDWFDTQRNKRKDKREGIAIDSSQSNVIRNTEFFGNALAAVTLYRNCGERGIRREWGASYNTITGGSFSDDILVASRQDKDLSEWDCLEPYVYNGKYVMDDAEFNVIENVTLQGNTRIVIMDDNNTIRNVTGGQVIANSTIRNALNQPIIGLNLRDISSRYVGDPAFIFE